MDDDALIALAAALALDAGAAILTIRQRGFDVVRKEDRSPVTEADHRAEAIIVAGLRHAAPGIPVIAEEEVAAGRITVPTAEYWLVDPLDGTREFAAGNDEFASNTYPARAPVQTVLLAGSARGSEGIHYQARGFLDAAEGHPPGSRWQSVSQRKDDRDHAGQDKWTGGASHPVGWNC